MISVICPVYNEEKFINECIQSMLNQDYRTSEIEFIFVDGMSDDKTRSILSSYSLKYPNVKILDNKKRIVPEALNLAIAAAQGEYIVRIDAHCKYPTNYISSLISNARVLNSDNIGGVCRTIPADDSIKSLAIAIGMSHKLGVGNSYFRVGCKNVMLVDTVPFGCFKKCVFDDIGLFDVDLIRNQDDELNARICNNGGKIYIIPDLVINYYARDTLKKLFKMFFQYGLFKPLVNSKLGSPATIRQFIPPIFVVGLLLGPVLFFLSSCLAFIYFAVIGLYILIVLIFTIKELIKNMSFKLILYLPCVFFILHFSYGYGYLKGLFNLLFRKKFQVSTSR